MPPDDPDAPAWTMEITSLDAAVAFYECAAARPNLDARQHAHYHFLLASALGDRGRIAGAPDDAARAAALYTEVLRRCQGDPCCRVLVIPARGPRRQARLLEPKQLRLWKDDPAPANAAAAIPSHRASL